MTLEEEIQELWPPISIIDDEEFWEIVDTCFQSRYARKAKRKMYKLIKQDLALALLSNKSVIRRMAEKISR